MIDIRNPRQYCEQFLRIIDKKGRLIPLRFKLAQVELYERIKEAHKRGPVRLVVLKGRQMGSSTMIEGIFFADTVTTPNAETLIMAHDDEATRRLFRMNKLFFNNLPLEIRPMLTNSNARELIFANPSASEKERKENPGLGSGIRCVTAGSRGAARSFTFRNVHGSEVAFWPNFNETHTAIMQAVPMENDTCVIYETTANGFNEFKEFWDKAVAGENGFTPIFLPWYLDPDYARPVEPGAEWTDEERELTARLGLTPEQLSWRRWCIATNCNGDLDMFHQEYPCTPEEAFLTTGRPYFDNARLALLLPAAPKPVSQGFFEYEEAPDGKPENIRWREDARRPLLRLWEEPQRGVPYVIGADSAGPGTDSFTMFCVENLGGMQVAEYQHQVSEILFARQLWCLGEWYNFALIALEVNYGSYAQTMLELWNYPRLYQRQRYDTIRKEYEKAYGFRTDTRTRPLMLTGLRTIMDEYPESVRSAAVLGQMLQFQYDKDGKPQAVEGAHDDLVLAAAICYQARTQQDNVRSVEPQPQRQKLIVELEKHGRRVK